MSSMSGRKFSEKHPVVVDIGCGCRRMKLYSLFSHTAPAKPKINPHTSPKYHHHPLSSSTNFSTSISHNFSFSSSSFRSPSSWITAVKKQPPPPPPKKKSATTASADCKAVKMKGRVTKESLAVVMESEHPYHDFRDSMMQMILEKEIYAWDDLRELLYRFLSLNSPYHHDSILRAFTEIWSDAFTCSTGGGGQAKRAGGGVAGRKHMHRYCRHDHQRRRMAREKQTRGCLA